MNPAELLLQSVASQEKQTSNINKTCERFPLSTLAIRGLGVLAIYQMSIYHEANPSGIETNQETPHEEYIQGKQLSVR